MFTSSFLKILNDRGFIDSQTDAQALDTLLSTSSITGYIGYDATATSLHVGHLLNIIMLRWFQLSGHTPIILIGGATTQVGDPSFRNTERPLLDTDTITENGQALSHIFEKILDMDKAKMVNNLSWTNSETHLDFLRRVGQHFSVNRMLAMESVKTRLETGSLSFLEFSYMLLQANDFLALNSEHNCQLQMGGSDQWGNIIQGIDLVRRVNGQTVFGLTTPLVTLSDGTKMGKSGGKAIWLDETLCSPFDFWQFWRNVPDSDVHRFLKLFTFLPLETCDTLGNKTGKDLNEAKIVLANEVTTLVHGAAAAADCETAAQTAFGTGQGNLPTHTLSWEENGHSLVDLLTFTGFSPSRKAARRLIQEGGARVNGEKILNTELTFSSHDLVNGVDISAGKKRHIHCLMEQP